MSVLPQSARRSRLVTAIAAIGFAVVLGTTGCSAGQVSQTANQLPAVNGASANHEQLELRDVQILHPDDVSAFEKGGPFEIAFVIISSDPLAEYRLTNIDAPKGSVTFERSSGDMLITPEKALRAGSPVGLLDDSARNKYESQITATLNNASKSIAVGLTTKLTFRFEKRATPDAGWTDAGKVVVDTPVDAGAVMTRQDQPRQAEVPPAEKGAEGHH